MLQPLKMHLQKDSSTRLIMCVAVVLLLGSMPRLMFGQMYNNQTKYTDASISGGTLHAWGYTYAPSGTSVNHTYEATVKIQLPGGRSSQSYGSGSGYSAATADTYITILGSDPDGAITVSTDHKAFCPFTAPFPFLTGFTYPGFDLGIKFTRTHYTGATPIPGPLAFQKQCPTVAACTNTSTPACGAGGIDVVIHVNDTCQQYYLTGFLAERAFGTSTWFCSWGLTTVVGGSGYCSPQ